MFTGCPRQKPFVHHLNRPRCFWMYKSYAALLRTQFFLKITPGRRVVQPLTRRELALFQNASPELIWLATPRNKRSEQTQRHPATTACNLSSSCLNQTNPVFGGWPARKDIYIDDLYERIKVNLAIIFQAPLRMPPLILNCIKSTVNDKLGSRPTAGRVEL